MLLANHWDIHVFFVQVDDDGIEDETQFLIAVDGGRQLLVTAVSYTVQTSLSVIEQVDHMRNSCRLLANGDLFQHEDLEAVQMGDTNNFIQSVIHAHLNTRHTDIITQHKFLSVFDFYHVRCNWVDANTQLLETSSCENDHAISGLICYSTVGEIRSLGLSPTGCSEINSLNRANTEVNMTFALSSDLVGCMMERNVTCLGFDQSGQEIASSGSSYMVNCRNETQVSVISHASNPVTRFQCSAPRFPNIEDAAEIVSSFYEIHATNSTIELDNKSNPFYSNGIIRLTEELYSYPFEINLVARGFPLQKTAVEFYEKFSEVATSPLAASNLTFDEQIMCSVPDVLPKVIVEHYVSLRFNEIHPENTGSYVFSVDIGNNQQPTTANITVEVVHPFKFECSNECGRKVPLGENYTIICTVDHHFVTSAANFEDPALMPIELVVSNLDNDKEYKFCHYSVPLFQNLTEKDFEHGDFKIDATNRKFTFAFEVFSVQSWNSGRFGIKVRTSDPAECLYQKEDCTNIGYEEIQQMSCTASSELGVVVFEVEIEREMGYPDLSSPNCGSTGNVPLYFDKSFGTFNDHSQFYYRFCRNVPSDQLGEAVCSEEGGEFNFKMGDLVTQLALFVDNDGRFYKDKVFRAMACQSYDMSFSKGDPTPYELKFRTKSAGVTHKLELNSSEMVELNSETEPDSILCRYKRGKAWKMSGEAVQEGCRYASMGPQTVKVRVHGDLNVSVVCHASPPGSAPAQTYEAVQPGRGFEYSLDIDDYARVEGFRCCQIWEDDSDCFDFSITGQYYPLEVNKLIEPVNLLCGGEQSGFSAQPCYGETSQLKCCMKANPVQNCNWLIRQGQVGTLVNGTRNITWDLHPVEMSQCMRPDICSVLTFNPLSPEHNGYYSCVCSNGFEGTALESSGRTQSQYIEITEHQSQTVGSLDSAITYHTTCGSPPEFYGTLYIPGTPIDASVKCRQISGTDYSYLSEDEIEVTRPDNDKGSDVKFNLFGSDRTRECVVEILNRAALSKSPYTLAFSLKRVVGFGSMEIYQDTSKENYESEPFKIACEVCAFAINNARIIKIECRTESDALLPFVELENNYMFDPVKNLGKKVEQLAGFVQETVACTCSLTTEPEHYRTLFFRANGEVEVEQTESTSEPTTTETQNSGETTITPTTKGTTNDATTITMIIDEMATTPTGLKTEEELIEEFQHLVNSTQSLAEARDGSEGVINYEEATEYLNTLARYVHAREKTLSGAQVETGFGFIDEILAVPIVIEPQNELMAEHLASDEAYANEMIRRSIGQTTSAAVFYVEDLIASNQDAPKFPYLIEKFEDLQDAFFHIGTELKAGSKVEVQTDHSLVVAIRMPDNHDEIVGGGELVIQNIDQHGVTRGALQGILFRLMFVKISDSSY